MDVTVSKAIKQETTVLLTVRLDNAVVMEAIRKAVKVEDIEGLEVESVRVVIPGGGDYSGLELDLNELDVVVVLKKVCSS